MWSVVMLSPSFKVSSALMLSPKGLPWGSSLMLGPRRTCTSAASPGEAGGRTALSSILKRSGRLTSILSRPRVLGSVISPVRAEATAVSGETR